MEACVLCVPGRRRAAAKPPAKPRQKLDTMFLGRDQLGNLAFREKYKRLLLPVLLLVRCSSGVMGPPYIGMTGNVQRTYVHPHIQAFPRFFLIERILHIQYSRGVLTMLNCFCPFVVFGKVRKQRA